jgi:TPR repeat protein
VDINAEKKIALEAEKEKNYAKSLSVWLTLSNAGDGQASYRAAFHYLNGWGLPIDINAATKAFEKSIEQGYGLAKYSYAKVVISGYHGIKKDPKKGLEMLKSAIASKDKSAFQAFERELKNKTVEPPAFLMEAARELYKEKAWETKEEALLEKLGIKR